MGVPKRVGPEDETATLAAPPGAATGSARRARRGPWLALALGLAATGAVLAVLGGLGADEAARSAPEPGDAEPGEVVATAGPLFDAGAADGGPPSRAETGGEGGVQVDAGTGPAREPQQSRGRGPDRRTEREEEVGPPEEPTPVPRPEEQEGALAVDHFVLVAGPGAVGTLVYVDGTPRGGAPGNVRLSLGTHEIELRRDGETVATRTVEVGPSHTRTSPVRWYVE